MNSFKVGDRVWIDGEKFIVIDIDCKNLMDLDVTSKHEYEEGYLCTFASDDDGIKLIKTYYATLGKTGVYG